MLLVFWKMNLMEGIIDFTEFIPGTDFLRQIVLRRCASFQHLCDGLAHHLVRETGCQPINRLKTCQKLMVCGRSEDFRLLHHETA